MNAVLSEQDCREFFGENVRRLIAKRGWNTLRLVEELRGSVPQNTVYRMVRGESYGTAPMQMAIAEVFGVTVDYLLTDPAVHEAKLPPRKKLSQSA